MQPLPSTTDFHLPPDDFDVADALANPRPLTPGVRRIARGGLRDLEHERGRTMEQYKNVPRFALGPLTPPPEVEADLGDSDTD